MERSILGALCCGLLLVGCQQGEQATNSTGTGSSGTGSSGTGSSGGATGGPSTSATTGSTASAVTTLAGGPSDVPHQCQEYGDAGSFDPDGVTVDTAGNAYVVSMNLDEVSPNGNVSVFVPVSVLSPSGLTFAPTGTLFAAEGIRIFSIVGTTPSLLAGTAFGCGDTGDPAGVGFHNVNGLVADFAGNVFVVDRYPEQPDGGRGCERVRKIDQTGVTTTIAGTGWEGFRDDANGLNAQFNDAQGIAIDGNGNLYVADTGNNRIRKIAPGGATTTLAGTGAAGFDDGPGGASGTATFNEPVAIASDAAGNLYVADFGNNSIRQVAPNGTVTTLAGNGTAGYRDGTLGMQGTIEFNNPVGVAIGPQGDIYVADYSNCRLRVIHPQ